MFKNGSANILHIRHSISPATRQINAAVCTVSSVPFASPTPSLCATLTLTPPPIPIRKPVNKDTNSVVEPTDPRGIYPAYFPTIATSLKLNNTSILWFDDNLVYGTYVEFNNEKVRPAYTDLALDVNLSFDSKIIYHKSYLTAYKQVCGSSSIATAARTEVCLNNMTKCLSFATKNIVEDVSKDLHLVMLNEK